MKSVLAAGIVGFIFALGLGLSGMTDPAKVLGFLDLFGRWDPSLAFVMAGSIFIHFFTYRWIRRRKSPLFSREWHVPTKTRITPSLAVGAILFGAGWGLAGYCPGPAITSLASLQPRPVIFVVGMGLGMVFFKILDGKFGFKR